MIRAVLLDLDDTLFDRRSALVAWAQATAREQGRRPLDQDALHALVEIDQRGLRARDVFCDDCGALFRLHVDPSQFPAALAQHVEPEPGVREAIAALAAAHRIAIVTNGGAAQRTKLARIGLDGIVHAVFVSGELGVAKPDPAFFAHALRWAECAPGEILVVGDQPAIDLAPAAALGMRTAWRARGPWPAALAPADHRLESIAELVGVCA